MNVKTSVPRIGKVTLKAGPNVVRFPLQQHDENRVKFLEHARIISGWHHAGEIGGWSIVVWNKDGAFSDASYLEPNCPITTTVAPSFVADVLRQRLINEGKL